MNSCDFRQYNYEIMKNLNYLESATNYNIFSFSFNHINFEFQNIFDFKKANLILYLRIEGVYNIVHCEFSFKDLLWPHIGLISHHNFYFILWILGQFTGTICLTFVVSVHFRQITIFIIDWYRVFGFWVSSLVSLEISSTF